jgi:NADH:ubiquinone oxidoreductase subunit 2 (subunit N)
MHEGVLKGFCDLRRSGLIGPFLYSAGYAVASLAAFAIAITVFKATGTESISGFNGLGKKNPMLAAGLTMAMLSLAGIPPFAGFFGKYFIFSEAIRNGYQNLVFLAIISSLTMSKLPTRAQCGALVSRKT